MEYLSTYLWLLPFLCFIQRFALTWGQDTAFDSWGHIYFIHSLKAGKSGPFGALRPKVVNGGEFHYPLFSHWLYSFIPNRWLIQYSHLVNPAVDAIFIAASILLLLKGGVAPAHIAGAALLYIFTPLTFSKISIGPRVANFTTRMVSEMILPLIFLLWYLDLGLAPWTKFAAFSSLAAVALLSSKFGVQALSFITILTAILTSDLSLFLAYLSALVISVAVSRGIFFSALKEQFSHLSWYFKSLTKNQLFVANRNSISKLVAWDSSLPFRENAQNFVFNWLALNSFTLVIIKAPAFLAAIILLLIQIMLGHPGDQQAFDMLILSGFIVYLATSLKQLLFLGEAERYLNHLAVFFCLKLVLADSGIDESGQVIAVLIGYGALYWLVEVLLFRIAKPFGSLEYESAVIEILRSWPEERTILSYPYHVLSPYRIMVQTHHRTFFPILADRHKKQELEPLEDYPFPELNKINILEEKFGVDTIIVQRNKLSSEMADWIPPLSWQAVPFSGYPDILIFVNAPETKGIRELEA